MAHAYLHGSDRDAFLKSVAGDLDCRFGIGHTTIRIERGAAPGALEPTDVIQEQACKRSPIR
ncbi:hypothetical protein EAH87_04300 [Sphingomonas koreensis]|nr:hypothetical protein EAH87_04300 [Sphingomonas koreensis]